MSKVRKLAVCVLVAAGALWLGFKVYSHQAALGKLRSLLNGDSTVRITRIEIRGQQKHVICTDEASLDFLTRSLRTAKNVQGLDGTSTYEARLFFGKGS